MTNYTPGYDRPIPKNLVEMAHDETGQWLKRDELETWVFRRFQRLEQQIKRLEEEHEAKVIQNAHLMRERDEYRNHLAVIAEMTGNAGDIGAAHEGVNAVIEECAARLKRVDFLNQQNTALQEQNDALAAHMARIKAEESRAYKGGLSMPGLLHDIIYESPTISLVRRDALKKAEALEEFAEGLPKFAHMGVEKALLIKSRALRRQAEAQQ